MATIRVLSSEDLSTLERGYISNPIDMPLYETFDQREYVLSIDEFMRVFQNWNRDRHPMLGMNDELSRLEIYLSQPQANRIKQAIEEGKESVNLDPMAR